MSGKKEAGPGKTDKISNYKPLQVSFNPLHWPEERELPRVSPQLTYSYSLTQVPGSCTFICSLT